MIYYRIQKYQIHVKSNNTAAFLLKPKLHFPHSNSMKHFIQILLDNSKIGLETVLAYNVGAKVVFTCNNDVMVFWFCSIPGFSWFICWFPHYLLPRRFNIWRKRRNITLRLVRSLSYSRICIHFLLLCHYFLKEWWWYILLLERHF